MPITFDIDRERKRLHAVADGPITYQEVEKHLKQEHDEGALAYIELIDARRAEPRLNAGELRQIVGLIRGLGLGSDLGRTAVLVPSDYAFGMIAMMGMYLDDICEIRAFRDEVKAHAWLGWEI